METSSTQSTQSIFGNLQMLLSSSITPEILTIFVFIFGTFLLVILTVIFFGEILSLKKITKKFEKFEKTNNENTKNTKNTKIDDKTFKTLSPNEIQGYMDFLNKLIKEKFDYYLYKEVLPVYLGNTKREKFKKEEFLKLKNVFYSDVILAIHPNIKKILESIYSSDGLTILIHQKFSVYFNKIDAEFFNKYEPDEKNIKDLFFMSEI